MKRIILTIFTVAITLQLAWGQTFSLTGTSPSNGTANVALSTTVTFTFSEAVNTDSVDWEEVISYEPYDSVYVEAVTLSSDNKTVRFQVEHTGNTDFIWFVFGAVSSDGDHLDNTYVLTYTTAGSLGSNAVSGTITTSQNKKAKVKQTADPFFDFNHKKLERLVARAVHHNRKTSATTGSTVLKTSGSNILQAGSMASQVNQDDYSNTVAVLVKSNFFESDSTDGDITAAAVVDPSSGDYTMEYVRNGTYWPMVMQLSDSTNWFSMKLGYYDENQDQRPDSIVINNQGASGIDMTLLSLDPITASAGIDRANSTALARHSDNELKWIQGYEFGYDMFLVTGSTESDTYSTLNQSDLTGKSQYWTYVYHSASVDSFTVVTLFAGHFAYSNTASVEDLGYEEDPDLMETISESFIDSDQAMATAEDNGGREFRATLSEDTYLLVQMNAGHLYASYPKDSTASAPVFWHMYYYAFSVDTTTGYPEVKWFSIYVDMSTGEVLDKVSTDLDRIEELPMQVALGQNYPNPFNPSTVIPFELTNPMHINLSIYNVLGQKVAVLADEQYSAGEHTITWDAANMPSGVYLYRLSVGDNVQTRKLMLAK